MPTSTILLKTILIKIIVFHFFVYFQRFLEIDDKNNTNPTSQSQPPMSDSVLPKVKHVIAIASGKGGVGKSTVASNVACGLINKGFKVGLLDLDIYGPSLPIILGVNEQPKMTKNNFGQPKHPSVCM